MSKQAMQMIEDGIKIAREYPPGTNGIDELDYEVIDDDTMLIQLNGEAFEMTIKRTFWPVDPQARTMDPPNKAQKQGIQKVAAAMKAQSDDIMVELIMMGNRIGLRILGEPDFNRFYKVNEAFRRDLVSDMKFARFVPTKETLDDFPWLKDHFTGCGVVHSLFFDRDWGEWQVRVTVDGELNELRTYHASDHDDAVETMKAMSDTSSLTNPADIIEWILLDMGVPSELIDDVGSFAAAATTFDSSDWNIEWNGGFWKKEAREKILAKLLRMKEGSKMREITRWHEHKGEGIMAIYRAGESPTYYYGDLKSSSLKEIEAQIDAMDPSERMGTGENAQ